MATNNKRLLAWVAEVQAMCKPDRVEWADGSRAEYDRLIRLMADGGMAIPLDPKKRVLPGLSWVGSNSPHFPPPQFPRRP